MKTVFIIRGYELEGSSDVLGVATTRAKADTMLTKAKRSNARKEPMYQHEYISLGEYRVGLGHLGKSLVVPRVKKNNAVKARLLAACRPKPVPLAPEFNRAVLALTPAIPS